MKTARILLLIIILAGVVAMIAWFMTNKRPAVSEPAQIGAPAAAPRGG